MKIDGQQISNKIFEDLKTRTVKLQEKNIAPHLAIILVGSNPASAAYVNQKELRAKEIGIKTTISRFPSDTSTTALLEAIQKFNEDGDIHGIIVQQPLPAQINPKNIVEAIDPTKDVDGFHPDSHFQMPIAMAVLKILEKVYTSTSGVEPRFVDWLKSKNIAIIGKGETGGKPIKNLFEKMKIPFTLIDSKTEKPENLTKKADIIISAVGKPNIINSKTIKRGVVLIGIGISRGESAKLMGDYDQNEVKDIAAFYTPTPGGVGPIDVSMLLKNLVTSAEISLGNSVRLNSN